jgi:hypothetical protein
MIGKLKSEMISRRRVFSLLGLPIEMGFVAAPTLLTSSGAEAQTAGWNGHRGGAQVADSTLKPGGQIAKSAPPSSIPR